MSDTASLASHNRPGAREGWSGGWRGVLAVVGAAIGGGVVLAQSSPVPMPKLPPKGPPAFFVSSVGVGRGGDLGGVEGGDRHCQQLADTVGLGGRQWHAYLSTSAHDGIAAVNARDRIGTGPWYNVRGDRIALDLDDLHGDTPESARRGNLISRSNALTEKGDLIPGDAQHPTYHDVLTGSRTDGRAFADGVDHTCRNWTYGGSDGGPQVGHWDRDSKYFGLSWNSAHAAPGCSVDRLALSGGKGLLYCFAADAPPR